MAAMQSSVRDRPAILISVVPRRQDDPALAEVQWGIEEEGVPQVTENAADEQEAAVSLAYAAAGRSRLGVGLALDQEGNLALHYFRMPDNRPLFMVRPEGQGLAVSRALGNNAARLVKGIPFKALEEDEDQLVQLRIQWEEHQRRRQGNLAAVYPEPLEEDARDRMGEELPEREREAMVRQVAARVLRSMQKKA